MTAFNALGSAQIKLQGFVPANRDATIKLTNTATNQSIERKPFLDGTLTLRDLTPGNYEIEVRHPNLTMPIDRRRILIPPTRIPTIIPIPVPSSLFTDTPIRDVPDADLAPVQQAAAGVRDQLSPVGGKAPGEVIRSTEWNTLVGAVSDLAGAVLQLTRLVAPRGHDHPEIADKISEVQENLRKFADSFGETLVALRREIELDKLDEGVKTVLKPGVIPEATRVLLADRVSDLRKSIQTDSTVFTGKLSATAALVQQALSDASQNRAPEAPDIFDDPVAKSLSDQAGSLAQSGRAIKASDELRSYKTAQAKSGGRVFTLGGLGG